MPCTPHPERTHTSYHSVFSTTRPTEVHYGTRPSTLSPTGTTTPPILSWRQISRPRHRPNGSTSTVTGAISSTQWTTLANTSSLVNTITSTALSARGSSTWGGRNYVKAVRVIRASFITGFRPCSTPEWWMGWARAKIGTKMREIHP